MKNTGKAASNRRSSRVDFFSSSRIADLLDTCAHQALNSSTILLLAGIATFIAALFFGPLNAMCAGGLLLFFLRQSRKERADAIRCGELWMRCYEISLPLNTASAITDSERRDETQAGISRVLADKVFPDGNPERPTLTSRIKRHFLRKVS